MKDHQNDDQKTKCENVANDIERLERSIEVRGQELKGPKHDRERILHEGRIEHEKRLRDALRRYHKEKCGGDAPTTNPRNPVPKPVPPIQVPIPNPQPVPGPAFPPVTLEPIMPPSNVRPNPAPQPAPKPVGPTTPTDPWGRPRPFPIKTPVTGGGIWGFSPVPWAIWKDFFGAGDDPI